MKIPSSFISEEIFILKQFNNMQESQISNFIDNLEQQIQTTATNQWLYTNDGNMELDIVPVEHIEGLTDSDYNIREIVTTFMPTYQRQAMLLTLWGAFEHEIEKAYLHVSERKFLPKQKKSKKKVSKFKHIVNSFYHLNLPATPSNDYREAINTLDNEVRIIRNIWAHNNGYDTKNNIPSSTQGIVKINNLISIDYTYITKVTDLMIAISNELNASILIK
ncbi:hypothetical protein C0W42_18415 [Photobacterium kishitanii]|nr:hypothetical protein [Photobacterium kishitanii]PSU86943.1 hypothetical protein C0W42_18415 [Photobacterium kishitanii]